MPDLVHCGASHIRANACERECAQGSGRSNREHRVHFCGEWATQRIAQMLFWHAAVCHRLQHQLWPCPEVDVRPVAAAQLLAAQCAMILWAYFATVTTDPGQVPAGWIPFADEQVRAAKQAREAGLPSVQQHLRGPDTSHQRSSAHITVRCAMHSKHGQSWSALLTATTSSVRKGAAAPTGRTSAYVDSMAEVHPRRVTHPAIPLVACGFRICRSERPPATALLQEVSGVEARACAPLLSQWPLYTQDGPLLYMGGQLCGAAELQGSSQSSAFLPICVTHTLYGARSRAVQFVVRTRGWQQLD